MAKKAEERRIRISEINREGWEHFSREVNTNLVWELLKVLEGEEGEERIPPIVVYYINDLGYLLIDGNHRVEAMLQRDANLRRDQGLSEINALIYHDKTVEQAQWDTITANILHGSIMKEKDRKMAALWLFERRSKSPNKKMSNRDIAKALLVGSSTVDRWAHEWEEKNGKTTNGKGSGAPCGAVDPHVKGATLNKTKQFLMENHDVTTEEVMSKLGVSEPTVKRARAALRLENADKFVRENPDATVQETVDATGVPKEKVLKLREKLREEEDREDEKPVPNIPTAQDTGFQEPVSEPEPFIDEPAKSEEKDDVVDIPVVEKTKRTPRKTKEDKMWDTARKLREQLDELDYDALNQVIEFLRREREDVC